MGGENLEKLQLPPPSPTIRSQRVHITIFFENKDLIDYTLEVSLHKI